MLGLVTKILAEFITFIILIVTILTILVWFREAVILRNHGLVIYKDVIKLGSTALLFSVISWLYNEKK